MSSSLSKQEIIPESDDLKPLDDPENDLKVFLNLMHLRISILHTNLERSGDACKT